MNSFVKILATFVFLLAPQSSGAYIGDCGQPITAGMNPVTTDATSILFTLEINGECSVTARPNLWLDQSTITDCAFPIVSDTTASRPQLRIRDSIIGESGLSGRPKCAGSILEGQEVFAEISATQVDGCDVGWELASSIGAGGSNGAYAGLIRFSNASLISGSFSAVTNSPIVGILARESTGIEMTATSIVGNGGTGGLGALQGGLVSTSGAQILQTTNSRLCGNINVGGGPQDLQNDAPNTAAIARAAWWGANLAGGAPPGAVVTGSGASIDYAPARTSDPSFIRGPVCP